VQEGDVSPDDQRIRAENIHWFAITGESATGAARRLDITRDALEKWSSRHAPEDWRRLAAREPGDPFKSDRARAAAASRWSA